MPFKSDAQRRWMFKNRPALAKEWANKYNQGGLIAKNNPNDEAMDVILNYFENGGGVHPSFGPVTKEEKNVKVNHLNITPRDILEFVPVVGDILAAEEVYRELQNDPVNWYLVGILTGGTAIGLIPGVGDAAAKAIKAGGRKLVETPKAALETLENAGGFKNFVKAHIDDLGKGEVPLEQAGSVGARAATDKTIYIKDLDGNVKPVSGTNKELSERYGISEGALKKKDRNTGFTKDDIQWSKDGEFKEFKSGKTVKAKEVTKMDPLKAEFSKTPARFPAKVSKEIKEEIADIVDDALVKYDAELIDADEFVAEIDLLSGIDGINIDNIVGSLDIDNAKKVSAAAWPEIVQGLRRFDNQLSPEEFNKVTQWAKNRSKSVYDVTDKVDTGPVNIDAMSGVGEAREFIRIPGAATRKRWKDEGFDPNAKHELSLSELKKTHGSDEGVRIYHNLKKGKELGILDKDYKVIETSTPSKPQKPLSLIGNRPTSSNNSLIQVSTKRPKRQ